MEFFKLFRKRKDKKDKSLSDRFKISHQKYFKKNTKTKKNEINILFRFFIIIITTLGVPFIFALVYGLYKVPLKEFFNAIGTENQFWIAVKEFYTGFLGLFTGFLSLMIGFFIFIKDQFVHQFKYVSTELNKKVDKHLQKTKIVFESGINDYDEKYLSVIQKILTEFETKYGELKPDGTTNPNKVNELYFIDHSSPIKWWSESMTGYMALISKWRANGQNRKVRRFFIYSENELLSPVAVKTIAFHSLMGFNTYIFSEKHFNNLFSEFSKTKKLNEVIKKKELFIWNSSTKYTVNFTTNDDVSWSEILFYQSFWNIDEHPKSERDILIETNDYPWIDYLKRPKKSNEITTWFEFIPSNDISSEMAEQYIEFIELLKKNTYCCMYKNDIDKIPKDTPNFGIKIKSIDCHFCMNDNKTNKRCVSTEEINGTKFGYTNSNNIAEILMKYSNYKR